MPDLYSRYLSYLVRLWQVREKRGWQWRGILESPGSGERYAFPDLDSLIAFLREQTDYLGKDKDEIEQNQLSEDE